MGTAYPVNFLVVDNFHDLYLFSTSHGQNTGSCCVWCGGQKKKGVFCKDCALVVDIHVTKEVLRFPFKPDTPNTMHSQNMWPLSFATIMQLSTTIFTPKTTSLAPRPFAFGTNAIYKSFHMLFFSTTGGSIIHLKQCWEPLVENQIPLVCHALYCKIPQKTRESRSVCFPSVQCWYK